MLIKRGSATLRFFKKLKFKINIKMEESYNPKATGVLDVDLSQNLFGANPNVQKINELISYNDLMQYDKKRQVKGEFRVRTFE